MKETKKIRAGVIGAGHMGRYHVGAYSELFNVEVVGVCDANPQNAELAASPFGYPVYTDYKELFGKIDVASVAVPTEMHYQVAKDLLDHGIHVLLEKPIAPDLDDAERLFEIATIRNLVLHIGHVERFNGAIQELMKIIDQPTLVESRRIGPWTGRSVETGVVMDLLIHDVDIVLNLVNQPVVDLHVIGRPVRSPYEDIAVVQMGFEGGAMATLLASRITEEKVRTLAVHQPDAYIFLDYSNQDIAIHRSSKSSHQLSSTQLKYRQESIIERLFVHKGNPLKFEIQYFLEHAMGNGNRMISVESELRSLKIALDVLHLIRRT